MNRETIETVGFVLAATGSVLGMASAILMANGYHPFTIGGFLGHLLSLIVRAVTFDLAGWRRETEATVEVSRNKAQNRTILLGALYLLFLAFLLELAGVTAMFFGSRR